MECVTCVCVWLRAGWEMLGVIELGLCFPNYGGTWGKWDMCPCFGCHGVGGVGGSGWSAWSMVWEGGCCYVCVCCESGLFMLMAGPGICILC